MRRRSARIAKSEDEPEARSATPGDTPGETPGETPEPTPSQSPQQANAQLPDQQQSQAMSAAAEPPRKARRGRPPGSRNRATIARELGVGEDELDEVLEAGGLASPRRRTLKTQRPSSFQVTPYGNRGMARTPSTVGGPAHLTAVPAELPNLTPKIHNDELDLPTDPAGEKKVAKDGQLQGGRDYRVRTFTVLGKGSRLYMLATEPARCMGFRDSYLLFQKHKRLHKVVANDVEKFDLIEREIIPHSYKGRSIALVTARSVFREFGARIIIGGKRVYDDYYETEAKNVGFVPGQLADPDDKLPPPGEPYNKNQYVAWHGASSIYHQNSAAPMLTRESLKDHPSVQRRRKVLITDENWMYEHAMATSQYNADLSARRRLTLKGGIYEPYTSAVFFPRNTQPERFSWSKTGDAQDAIKQEATDDNDDDSGKQNNEKVVIETVVQVANPFVRTGLKDVSPEIYDHLPEDIKQSIERQKNNELQWDQFATKVSN
uniref:ARAD1C14388p n=1 Tax=Blastobotrys adeninivorans TaxID=409370 RepID=A0A060T5Q5_BLAAD